MWGFLTFFILCEFFSIFGFRFFRMSFDHLLSVTNLFKQHPSHMMPQKILKSPNKWKIWRYEECEDSSHSSYPCDFFSIFRFRFFRISFDHLLSVTDLFKQHPNHMMPQKILKSLQKWRIGRVRKMWGFLTFFVLFLIF